MNKKVSIIAFLLLPFILLSLISCTNTKETAQKILTFNGDIKTDIQSAVSSLNLVLTGKQSTDELINSIGSVNKKLADYKQTMENAKAEFNQIKVPDSLKDIKERHIQATDKCIELTGNLIKSCQLVSEGLQSQDDQKYKDGLVILASAPVELESINKEIDALKSDLENAINK